MQGTSNIENKDALIAELRAKISEQSTKISEQDSKIASLESELSWLRKKVFGKMSEKKLPVNPMEEPTLFDEAISESESLEIENQKAKDEEVITRTITVKSKRENRKALDTSNLPVEEQHIYPEGINEEEYVELSPEITDSLAIKPAQIYVKRIVRHKYVLKFSLQIQHPEQQAFKIAPLPPSPINKCMASSSLLADIIIEKFH